MITGYIQLPPEYLAVEENLNRAEELIANATADLIVLPELFQSGYFFRSEDDLKSVAESVPEGPTTQRLQEWASGTGATLVAGLAEREGEAIYNSSILVRPDGTTETYRKVHLFYEETTLFTPGDLGFPVFDATTRSGRSYRLGMMVCFDWYFPEATRSLALNGADVIAHPSNLVLPHCPDAMPIRARENHVFTITANRYGSETKDDETLRFIGLSEVCDPGGDVLCQAGREETTVDTVDLDPHRARERAINQYNDTLSDRRPEAYVTSADYFP